VIIFDARWHVARDLTVMAHEGAHAAAGSVLFRSIRGVERHADAAGTESARPQAWPPPRPAPPSAPTS